MRTRGNRMSAPYRAFDVPQGATHTDLRAWEGPDHEEGEAPVREIQIARPHRRWLLVVGVALIVLALASLLL